MSTFMSYLELSFFYTIEWIIGRKGIFLLRLQAT